MIQFIRKLTLLQEKNLICARLANNIAIIVRRTEEPGQTGPKNSHRKNAFFVVIVTISKRPTYEIAIDKTGNMAKRTLILAVETSSRIGSVAIALGGKVLAETVFSGPLMHSAEIFPAIRGLLERFGRKPSQIEHVYISGGPGSFTGLRIATTLAKTMHLANAARVVKVDTLDVVAANVVNLTAQNTLSASNHGLQAISDERVAAVLDAKRGQFFIAVYDRNTPDRQQRTRDGIWRKVLPDSSMTISQFLARFACRERPIWLLGDGLLYYKDRFQADGIRFLDEKYWSPRAGKVHLLGWQMALKGQFADPLTLTPDYLRKPDVTIKPR